MPTKTNTSTATRQRGGSRPAPEALAQVDGAPAPHPLSQDELNLLGTAAPGTGEASAETAAGPPPTMAPPQTGMPAEAGAAVTGKRVLATWAEQSNRNAWVYLDTVGWKKLSPLTDTGSTTMTILAAHARATGSAPYADENPAGTIGVLYVW